MTAPGKDHPGCPARRARGREILLYAAFVLVVVFTAWQIGIYLAHQAGGPLDAIAAPRTGRAAVSRPALDAPGGVEGLSGSLAREGIRPVAGDPANIPPPPGAKRVYAMELSEGSVVGQYQWAGDEEQAAEHYRRAAAGAGFSPHGDLHGASGRHILVFDGPKRLIVALRKHPGQEMIVDVTVSLLPQAR